MFFLFLFSVLGGFSYLILKDRKKKSRAQEAIIEGYHNSTATSSVLLSTFLLTSPAFFGKILITRMAVFTIGVYTFLVFIVSSVVAYSRKGKRHESTT